MVYSPEDQEILKQHYAGVRRNTKSSLKRFVPHLAWVLYGLAGTFGAIILSGLGPSLNPPEVFIGSSFQSGGFPFNAFSTENLPGISPLHPLRFPVVLINYVILLVLFFVLPLLIIRRRQRIAKGRLILLMIMVLLGFGLLILGVAQFNQPLYGGINVIE